MLKFIYKSLVFLLGVVLLNLLFLKLIEHTDYDFRKRKESLSFVAPQFDLIILGNSLAMDGIDSEIFELNGIKTYNLALGGASVKSSYIQLEEYLEKYDYKPQYVILALGSYMMDFDGKEIHPIIEFTSAAHHYTVEDIPMLKFRWLAKEMLKKLVSKRYRDAYLVNGHLRFEKQVPDMTKLVPEKEFPLEEFTSSIWIEKTLRLCEDNNIKLFILEMPGYKNTRHKKSFDKLVLGEEYCNGLLYDCNSFEFTEIFDDRTDWIGNSHLNVYGSQKFTKKLYEELEDEFIPLNP